MLKLIRDKSDERVVAVVQHWCRNFAPEGTLVLGSTAEDNFRQFLENLTADELKR